MARGNLRPVSIAGIEADALLSEEASYAADIPEYPVENGYSVSDTIIIKPMQLAITMYFSDSPATWRRRSGHSPSIGRARRMCDKLEDLYFSRALVKVVSSDKIYTSMGITSLSISKTQETGYSLQASMTLKKVYVTAQKTVMVPAGIAQSGTSKASAGAATTSTTSSSSGSSGGSGGSSGSSGSSSGSSSESTKKSSILYGVASGLGFL